MRYIVSPSFNSTVLARQVYLFDTVRLWTRAYSDSNEYTILESVPEYSLDVLFIVGHNKEVELYIRENKDSISESTVVLIMCSTMVDFSVIRKTGKKLYISNQGANGTSELYNGIKYGFEFNLTESEIILYTNKFIGDVKERIEDAFTLIN